MSWLDLTVVDHQVQRSPAWFEWRRKHIGASEVPAIMGTCDFNTPHDVWMLKTGRKEPFMGNFATQRGIDAEPVIKALYEKLKEVPLTAPVLEYIDWPVLGASLDGYNESERILADWKYPSKEKHEIALSGKIPQTYTDQMQTQLLVTGFDSMDYVSFDGKEIAVVSVAADKTRQAEIIIKCKHFWEYHVLGDNPPPTKYKVKEGKELQSLAYTYSNLLIESRALEDKLTATKQAIFNLVPEEYASFYGLSIRPSGKGRTIKII